MFRKTIHTNQHILLPDQTKKKGFIKEIRYKKSENVYAFRACMCM